MSALAFHLGAASPGERRFGAWEEGGGGGGWVGGDGVWGGGGSERTMTCSQMERKGRLLGEKLMHECATPTSEYLGEAASLGCPGDMRRAKSFIIKLL